MGAEGTVQELYGALGTVQFLDKNLQASSVAVSVHMVHPFDSFIQVFYRYSYYIN